MATAMTDALVLWYALAIGAVVFFIGYIVSNTTNSLYALAVLVSIVPIYFLCRKFAGVSETQSEAAADPVETDQK